MGDFFDWMNPVIDLYFGFGALFWRVILLLMDKYHYCTSNLPDEVRRESTYFMGKTQKRESNNRQHFRINMFQIIGLTVIAYTFNCLRSWRVNPSLPCTFELEPAVGSEHLSNSDADIKEETARIFDSFWVAK
jgi:hypothetical protein